mmetsp:Transcript_52202/g.124440  ORF Transcript_52202/g.124440 Transcript_52202/m.124440 type:complete len:215 (+) Transcript_52202:506-1150(+)
MARPHGELVSNCRCIQAATTQAQGWHLGSPDGAVVRQIHPHRLASAAFAIAGSEPQGHAGGSVHRGQLISSRCHSAEGWCLRKAQHTSLRGQRLKLLMLVRWSATVPQHQSVVVGQSAALCAQTKRWTRTCTECAISAHSKALTRQNHNLHTRGGQEEASGHDLRVYEASINPLHPPPGGRRHHFTVPAGCAPSSSMSQHLTDHRRAWLDWRGI